MSFVALAADRAMQVENDVDTALGRLRNRLVQVLPGIGAQRVRSVLVLDEVVNERQAHDVETERGDAIPIAIGHPTVTERVHQTFALGVTEPRCEHALQRALIVHRGVVRGDDGVVHHPELEQQPVTQVQSAKVDASPVLIHPERALLPQSRQRGRTHRHDVDPVQIHRTADVDAERVSACADVEHRRTLCRPRLPAAGVAHCGCCNHLRAIDLNVVAAAGTHRCDAHVGAISARG
jgi:hypothetical protein